MTFVALALTALLLVLAFRSLSVPSIAVPIFLSMFAVKQVFFGGFGFVVPSWAPNVAIGVLCGAVIVWTAIQRGVPRSDGLAVAQVMLLALLATASLLWTRAPTAAEHALTTFLPGVLLALGLGLVGFRKPDDMVLMLKPLVMIGLTIALALLVARVPGVGGRLLIVEEGTVLSPSKYLGFVLIALLVANRAMLSWATAMRLSLVLFLVLAVFLMGARGQFVAALLVAAVGGLVSGTLGRRGLLAAAGAAVVLLMSPLAGALLGFEQVAAVAERYTADMVREGWQARVQMVTSSLVLSAPVFGHGVLDWAFHMTAQDQYIYPHNSLAQVFFELGIIGLVLFVGIGIRALILLRGVTQSHAKGSAAHGSAVLIGCFLVYEFLLSQKQGTFMSPLGYYLFAVGGATFAILSSGKKTIHEQRLVRSPWAPAEGARLQGRS